MTEYSSLRSAYDRSGRDGLIDLIRQRIADKTFAENVYILVDPSLAVLAGNSKAWPSTAWRPRDGRSFARPSRRKARQTGRCCGQCSNMLPNGDRLLVGRDISDLDSFTDQIKAAVISGVVLIFVLAGVASILVTRRTVGRIE